jgi:hypothetical protein
MPESDVETPESEAIALDPAELDPERDDVEPEPDEPVPEPALQTREALRLSSPVEHALPPAPTSLVH